MTSWTTVAVGADIEAAAALLLASGEGDSLMLLGDAGSPIGNALRRVGWQAKPGRWLDSIGDEGHQRLLILGVEKEPDPVGWLSIGGHLVEAMRALHLTSVRLPAAAEVGEEAFEGLVTGALLHGFRLDQGRQQAVPGAVPLNLVIDPADQAILDRAVAATTPINRARAWVDQPANLLIPSVFAEEAGAALAACGATVRILDRAELEALGAGGILAVGQASRNEARLLVAEWRGAPDRDGWDAVLVGKGITFDSGGLNIKTRPIIEKMKLDMGGAAAVIGAFEAAASRGARANVALVVPMAENSIGSDAYRPGDVIRMLSGHTVEVLNTDAEGRLVLADGVTYGLREYDPKHIVDVATLTGSITGILHEEYAGIYASTDDLASGLDAAGAAVDEPLWRLPLTARQDYLVDSPVADIANLGAPGLFGAGVGSPAAGAKFIERFAKGRSWAHVDIAGVAMVTRRTRRSGAGATGFGVALLDRWISTLEG